MAPDLDGTNRRMPCIYQSGGRFYAPLALSAITAYTGEPLGFSAEPYGVKSIRVGQYPLPVDEYGRMMINYRGPTKTFPHYSIVDLLNGKIPASRLKDRIVFVGATAVGIYDLRVTPFDNTFPGLEIHANLADTVISGDYLQQPVWIMYLDVLAMVASALVLGFVLPRIGAIIGAFAALVLFFGYMALCQYMFETSGLILNIVYPLLVLVLVYIGITVQRYLAESRKKRFIQNAFSTYLAPSVVKTIIDHPERLKLGGEKRTITAFFSDVEGFTRISEKLPPDALVELLNEFLTEMTDIILHLGGTVDKFEGDAIIAMFGAPVDLDNQALVACRACVQMQNKLARMREVWNQSGKEALKMRIGLCTGPAVVGNMGSRSRMDYTMMGDTVNIAARLEGVNKTYGTYTMISETTREAVGEEVIARELDRIYVVGRAEPLSVYELIGLEADIPADDPVRSLAEVYAKGLAFYRDRNFAGAADHFRRVLEFDPDDGPGRVMLVRCQQYAESPPPDDWDGVFTLDYK
jgi:adenylate cyclase